MILSGFPLSKWYKSSTFDPKIWIFDLFWCKNLLACILENVICTSILPVRYILGIYSIYWSHSSSSSRLFF